MIFENFQEAYPALVDHCLKNGISHTPRGFQCRELRQFSFSLKDPTKMYQGKSRKLNYQFLAIETSGYLSGVSSQWFVDLLVHSNSQMKRFINPSTGRFDGMYGPRLIKSYETVVKLLRKDPSSRQAVASIWSPGIPQDSLDVPCTVMLHFMNVGTLEEPVLGMTVYMRSNDLNWGTPYDVMAFCTIQCQIAKILGWPVGNYTHHVGSLHVYESALPDLSDSSTEWCPLSDTLPVMNVDNVQHMIGMYERFLIKSTKIVMADRKEVADIVMNGYLNEFEEHEHPFMNMVLFKRG